MGIYGVGVVICLMALADAQFYLTTPWLEDGRVTVYLSERLRWFTKKRWCALNQFIILVWGVAMVTYNYTTQRCSGPVCAWVPLSFVGSLFLRKVYFFGLEHRAPILDVDTSPPDSEAKNATTALWASFTLNFVNIVNLLGTASQGFWATAACFAVFTCGCFFYIWIARAVRGIYLEAEAAAEKGEIKV
jgi:hypothetical protein